MNIFLATLKLQLKGEDPVPVCTLEDPANTLLLFLMKEFLNGGSNEKEQFLGFKLSSARMVIECAYRRLKERFDCLGRKADINIKDLPYVIHACFCQIISASWTKSLPIKILLKLSRNMTVNSNQQIKALDIKQVIMKVQGKNQKNICKIF